MIQDEKILTFERSTKARKSKMKQNKSWLWLAENTFEAERDEVMNVLIRVPATAGYENKPVIVFRVTWIWSVRRHLKAGTIFQKTP